MKGIYKYFPFLVIIFAVCIFFYPFVYRGKLPIPADTIVGLYYPFRDLYSKTNPNGLPYKNFLVTDPVRQQYPWKNLVVNLEKQLQIPVWNPYEMAGIPLAANFQSSPFYPLNIILLINPFSISWSVFILIQPLLAGLFLYLYLKNLRLDSRAALLGAIIWAFCGFSIAWMEWGTVMHTGLWLPLILLSADKLLSSSGRVRKKTWSAIFIFSMSCAFFAGHLQTFFYLFLVSVLYIASRFFQRTQKTKDMLMFTVSYLIFAAITCIQWLPTLQFILLSNRSSDQSFTQPGWFVPYQNLVQFIVPDFFGNPATLNYFGVWNYAEFVGYAGIASFILALYSILFRRDKKTYFFLGLTFFSILFATSNVISQVPYALHIPFVSTAQPTRLMFLVDLGISVLAALGFDYFLKKQKNIWVPVLVTGGILMGLFGLVYFGRVLPIENLGVVKSNLKLPIILFGLSALLFIVYPLLKDKKIINLSVLILFFLILFDLFRFGWKFSPFSNQEYLYPNTPVISFLQKQPGLFRIASFDSRILPPNFSVMYHLQSIEGYDPLYLLPYAQLIAANERGNHSPQPPFGFNRIITPRNIGTQVINLLNVKYVLSLDTINTPKFKKVFEDGQTKVYENTQVFPRAFFAQEVLVKNSTEEEAQFMFDPATNLKTTAVIHANKKSVQYKSVGTVTITAYQPSEVVAETDGPEGFLVLTDAYYPVWKASVDNLETPIYKTDIALRGIFVPAGAHVVRFKASLFGF